MSDSGPDPQKFYRPVSIPGPPLDTVRDYLGYAERALTHVETEIRDMEAALALLKADRARLTLRRTHLQDAVRVLEAVGLSDEAPPSHGLATALMEAAAGMLAEEGTADVMPPETSPDA